MEWVNVIVQLISGVGFPIVVSIALFWKLNETDKNHKEEVEKLRETIEQNTLVIHKLCDKLGD